MSARRSRPQADRQLLPADAEPALPTAAMVEASASLEWMLVQSEVEALQLEYNLIKQHRPATRPLPRRQVVPVAGRAPGRRDPPAAGRAGPQAQGDEVLLAYAHAYAIQETLDLLLRTFPMRTCSKGCSTGTGASAGLHPVRHQQVLRTLRRQVTPDEHRQIVEDFVTFMDGRTRPTLQRLEAEMRQAAEELNFELAAARPAGQRPQGHGTPADGVLDPEDFDIAAFAEDDLEAAVQVFFVRRGRVVGRRGFVVDKVEALDTASLAATFVQQLYGDRADEVPREVFLPVLPEGADGLRALAGRAARRAGRLPGAAPGEAGPAGDGRGQRPRGLRHPQAQAGQRLRRPGPGPQGAPGGPGPARGPAAIECLRHLQPPGQPGGGLDGGVRGRPRPQERVPPLRGPLGRGPGRRGLLREVLTRRLARLATERDEPEDETGRRKKFAAQPDRGRRRPAQLAAALDAVRASASPDLPVVSLAKRMEEVYVPARPTRWSSPDQRGPVPPPAVRDEAHRFAITYHRKLRDRSMTRSVLDGIPGVGETRQRQLVRHFGSARRAAQASLEELEEVPGVGPQLAKVVYDHLHGGGPGPRAQRCPRPTGTPGGAEPMTQELRTEDRLRAAAVEFVVITGLSGAGRSRGGQGAGGPRLLRDRQPAAVADRAGRRAGRGRPRPDPVALVMDARGGAFTADVSELTTALDQLRAQDVNLRVVFLEASDEVLIRRFEATRRRHPVAGERVAESIALERDLLRELRADADLVLDTSDLNVHELRAKILAAFADEAAGLLVTVTSFGFKYGLPLDADMVVDVRFLPNPHWVPELRPLPAPTRRCATTCSPRTAPACSWPGWRRCWRRPCPATSRRASST